MAHCYTNLNFFYTEHNTRNAAKLAMKEKKTPNRAKKVTETRKTVEKSKAQFDAIKAAKDDMNKLEKLVNKKEKVAKKKFEAAQKAQEEVNAAEEAVEAAKFKLEVLKRKGHLEEIFWRFPHLKEKIFDKLDNKNLAKCQQVSMWWQKIISEDKIILIRGIEIVELKLKGISMSFSTAKLKMLAR